MDTTERELSMLPVRVPQVTAMDVYQQPFQLAKVTGLNGTGTSGSLVGPGAVMVELYGYAKSSFTLHPSGPLLANDNASWRFSGGAPWWQGFYGGSPVGLTATTPNAEFLSNLTPLPSNAKTIRSVEIHFGASRITSQPLTLAAIQIVKSDGITPLTEETSPEIGTGASYIHRPSIIGGYAVDDWNGAKLRIVSSSGVVGRVSVYSPTVKVSYRINTLNEKQIEATGERLYAFSLWTLRPGKWCYVQKFPWGGGVNVGFTFARIVIPDASLFGFAIALSTTSITIDSGSTRVIAINVVRGGGFAGAVNISVAGLVSGVTASLSPAIVTSVAPGSGSALTLTADGGTPTQRFVLMVAGISGNEERQEYVQVLVRKMSGNFSIATAQPSYSLGLSQISIVVNVQSLDVDFATVFIDTPLIDAETGGGKAQNYSPISQTVTVGEMSQGSVTFTLRREGGPYIAGTYTVTVRGRSRDRTVTTSFTLVQLP